jgi:hypothetical protein
MAGLVLAWQKQPSPESLALPCSRHVWAFTNAFCHSVRAFDRLLTSLIVVSMILLIWDTTRFWSVWRELRSCLEQVGATPVLEGFVTLPASVAQLAKLTTFVPPGERLTSKTLQAAVRDRWHEFRALGGGWTSPIVPASSDDGDPALCSQDLCFDAAAGAEFMLIYDQAVTHTGSVASAAKRDARQVVRELTALHVMEYVERIMRQLRYLAVFLLTTIFLTILLLSSYPLEPESLIKSAFLIVMTVTTLALLSVLFQRNRNPMLRAMAQMNADEGMWNVRLVINLLLILGVPALAMLGSAFPEVRSILFSWIEPLLQALSKS